MAVCEDYDSSLDVSSSSEDSTITETSFNDSFLYDTSSSSSDDSTEGCFSPVGNQPLYVGAKLSISETHLKLLHFGLKHGLTNAAFDELLQLIRQIIPQDAVFPRNIRSLRKFFNETYGDTEVLTHRYCQCCNRLLKGPCLQYSSCCKASVCKFVTVPIGQQLKTILEGKLIINYVKNNLLLL